ISYAGLLLILFGVVLLIAEIKVVSHGVLAIGGVVAMLLGSLMLYDVPETGGIRLSWLVIIPTVGTTAGLVFFAVTMGIRALYRPSVTGSSAMVGRVGVTRSALGPEGQVLVDGELWRAVSEDGRVEAGEPVRITAIDGLTLKVARSAQRP
ncbi:MAG TPA: NfeD family protein, partial [Methylomirabilota bacterium]